MAWNFLKVFDRPAAAPVVAQANPETFEGQLAQYLTNQNYAQGGLLTLGLPGLGNQRNTVIYYSALSRAATLISAVTAQLISGGDLSVRDREGRRVDNRRTQNILEVLSRSPDMGNTSSSMFIEDCAIDYALDGNSLIVPSFLPSGALMGLTRYRSYDAHIVHSDNRAVMYQMLRADNDNEGSELHAARDVMHVRWPRLIRYGLTTNAREGFALAPVVALHPALSIGMKQDQFIDQWFADGSKPGVHVNYKTMPDKPTPDKDQRNLIVQETRKVLKAALEPLVTFDADSSVLDPTPQNRDSKELRDFQVEEVARYFGLPLPLLSVSIRQWGAAVNEQVMKMAWRTGFKPHVDRFLAPFSLRLLMPGERFVVDPVDFVRGDAEGVSRMLMALAGDMQRAPVATRGELRHIADLPEIQRGSSWHPSRHNQRPTQTPSPAMPCHASPCRSRAEPRPAMISLPCRARPSRAVPDQAAPAAPSHATIPLPRQALPRPAMISLPCLPSPAPRQAWPIPAVPCPAWPRRAAPRFPLPCPAEPCPATPQPRHAPPPEPRRAAPSAAKSKLIDRHRLEPTVVTGLLRPPVAKANPPPRDVQPSVKLFLVDKFGVNFDGERHTPLVELRAGPKNARTLDNHADRELNGLTEFIHGLAELRVVVERRYSLDDQAFADLRTLFQLPGAGFDHSPKRCLRECRRSFAVEPKRGLAFEFAEPVIVDLGAVGSFLSGDVFLFFVGSGSCVESGRSVVHDERANSLEGDFVSHSAIAFVNRAMS